MAYGRVQRPVIAAAIQRSVSASNHHSGLIANSNLRRYLQRIGTVLLVTVLYTAFVYTHGTTKSTVCGIVMSGWMDAGWIWMDFR